MSLEASEECGFKGCEDYCRVHKPCPSNAICHNLSYITITITHVNVKTRPTGLMKQRILAKNSQVSNALPRLPTNPTVCKSCSSSASFCMQNILFTLRINICCFKPLYYNEARVNPRSHNRSRECKKTSTHRCRVENNLHCESSPIARGGKQKNVELAPLACKKLALVDKNFKNHLIL